MTKIYRVQVETNDGCVTSWYEQSRAKDACNIINDRVYEQLCGLNIKEVSVTPSVWIMITSKAQMLRVIKTAALGTALTREEKFQVFANVCDNMLAEGRITKENHKRWTNVF